MLAQHPPFWAVAAVSWWFLTEVVIGFNYALGPDRGDAHGLADDLLAAPAYQRQYAG